MHQQTQIATIPVSRNLLLQAIAYLDQHSDPMTKMLRAQCEQALRQESEQNA